jgi:hypothetical protein
MAQKQTLKNNEWWRVGPRGACRSTKWLPLTFVKTARGGRSCAQTLARLAVGFGTVALANHVVQGRTA